MSEVKRIDPRRPCRITHAGLRRIVLGEIGAGVPRASEVGSAHLKQGKPLRTRQPAERWHMAVVHSYRGRLDEHAREAIAAAAILAAPATGVIAVVLGELHEDMAAVGADNVVIIPDLDAGRVQPEREVAAVMTILDAFRPDHIFMPDNLLGDGDLGRRLIAIQGNPAATHVAEIDAHHVSVPWSGGAGLAHAPLPRFVLLEPQVVDANLPFVGVGEHLPFSKSAEVALTTEVCRDLGLEPTESTGIALEEADFIVSAGNGVRHVETLENLARTLGAAVGASRVAVDEGKFPRDKQIGASGKSVSATTYFAIGISGAVQHLQGIKDCRHVIAINRDAGAPIVKRADLTVVGDAEDLMQALITRVSQARNQRDVPEAR